MDLSKVDRFEVIDGSGRVLVAYGVTDLQFDLQDDGRTLKVFYEIDKFKKEQVVDEITRNLQERY